MVLQVEQKNGVIKKEKKGSKRPIDLLTAAPLI
jgi:hypothetical protein